MSPSPFQASWWHLVRTVFRKELLDGIRDRRALASALAFPLLSPVLVAFMFTAIAQDHATPPVLELPVAGAEHAPGLVQFLETAGADVVEPPEDPEQAVALGNVPLVLVVDADYAEDFREGHPATVHMWVDSSRNANRTAVSRATRLVEAYGSQTAVQRLILRGVDPQLVSPVHLTELDAAGPQQRGANLLEMLVMMAVMAAFLGSMYLAMDSTAGERERRSLEPLLSLPIPRSSLVVGKFLAAVSFGTLGVLLATATMNLTPLELLGVRVVLTAPAAFALVGVLLPLVPVAASLQLLVASGATSFKEAQTWLSMTLFLPMMPGMVMTVRPVNPQTWMAVIPGLGQQVLSSKVLRGDGLTALDMSLAVGASLLITAVALVALTVLFEHERVLKRG
jgi:sodium transport system permease protein